MRIKRNLTKFSLSKLYVKVKRMWIKSKKIKKVFVNSEFD